MVVVVVVEAVVVVMVKSLFTEYKKKRKNTYLSKYTCLHFVNDSSQKANKRILVLQNTRPKGLEILQLAAYV